MAEKLPFRMTLPTQHVLRALLDRPAEAKYGLEICAGAGLPSGTIHPILARLEGAGWLRSEWEAVDPAVAGRPRRRYYWLTEDGAARARDALARIQSNQAVRANWRPAEGGAM